MDSTQEMIDSFDAAYKERAGKGLDDVRAMAEQIGKHPSEVLHVPNGRPAHRDYRNSKVQRLRRDRHGLSRASRLQEAILGSCTSEVLADGSVPVLVVRRRGG